MMLHILKGGLTSFAESQFSIIYKTYFNFLGRFYYPPIHKWGVVGFLKTLCKEPQEKLYTNIICPMRVTHELTYTLTIFFHSQRL